MKIAWKKQKTQEILGTLSTTRTPFFARHGHPWTPEKSPKTALFPRRIVLCNNFPGICRRFRQKILSQTPKKNFLGPRSYSKGWKKVLTSETPCRYINQKKGKIKEKKKEERKKRPPRVERKKKRPTRNRAPIEVKKKKNQKFKKKKKKKTEPWTLKVALCTSGVLLVLKKF